MPKTIRLLKTELNVTSPWIFVGFISHPLWCMCLTKTSNVLATSYSFWSNQHDIINIADQYYIQMLQISSGYIMTEDRKVSRALRKKKNYKCILLSIICEYKLLLMFQIGIEKTHTFSKSVADYQVLKTMSFLSCEVNVSNTAALLMSLFD